MSAFHAGDVVHYTPADGNHCREGQAIARVRNDGSAYLADTFWISGGDAHVLTPAEIETAEVIFNLSDYDELPRFDRGSPMRWERYARADRQVVTSQHALQSRWFIRKGASEDLPTQVENARQRLARAESELDLATRDVDRARRELAAMEALNGARAIDVSAGT